MQWMKLNVRKSGLAIAALMACTGIALPLIAGTQKHETAPSAKQSQVEYGRYLVTSVAGCSDCHTPMGRNGEPDQSKWLQGTVLSFAPLHPMPWAKASPDIAGLPGWTTEQATRLLMTGVGKDGRRPLPPMPQYRMNHRDAAAIAAYLKSLK